jgi:HEAT repeat protein
VLCAAADEDAVLRQWGVAMLRTVKIDSAAAMRVLLEALEDPDAEVRAQAAEEITSRTWSEGARRAVPVLARRLHAEDCRVRHAAARTLRIVGTARAVPDLIRLLHDPDRDVRAAAALALGALGDPRAVPDLIAARRLHGEYEPIHALGQIGGESALAALIDWLEPDSDTDWQAVTALGFMGPGARAAVPALAERLNRVPTDEDTVRTLGRIGGEGAARALVAAIEKQPAAVAALGEAAGSAGLSVPVLTAALERTAGEKSMAATALGRFGAAAAPAVPALLRSSEDAWWFVRTESVLALGKIGVRQDRVVSALRAHLAGESRIAAACSLVRLGEGDENLLSLLRRAVEEKGCLLAAALLAERGEAPDLVLRTAARALTEGTGSEHEPAMRILGSLGSRAVAAVPAIRRALGRDDWSVCYAAVDALRLITRR